MPAVLYYGFLCGVALNLYSNIRNLEGGNRTPLPTIGVKVILVAATRGSARKSSWLLSLTQTFLNFGTSWLDFFTLPYSRAGPGPHYSLGSTALHVNGTIYVRGYLHIT